jgi:hypothetical protein
LERYQQSTELHPIAMQLVSMQTNSSSSLSAAATASSMANTRMRQVLGPLCEVTNPFPSLSTLLSEYGHPDISSRLNQSWQRGEDLHLLPIHCPSFSLSSSQPTHSLTGLLTLKYIRVKEQLTYW